MPSSRPDNDARAADRRRRTRLPYERRIALWSFLVAAPGLLFSGLLIWFQPWSAQSKLTLLAFGILAWWILSSVLKEQATRPLQTLANVIASLREEDYSFRARSAIAGDALGDLSLEVNALADLLSEQRAGAVEATALLQRVVEEIDVPLFAFDPSQKLRLVNPAGQRVLQKPNEHAQGKTAEELGLQGCLSCENGALLTLGLGGTEVRWLIRRSAFREKGIPHKLVVLSDVSHALREEERKAWQRLIRVLGHELNNSLAPIQSIAGSLGGRVSEMHLTAEESKDFRRGLEIIETRAVSLNRFLQAYRQLAQMPPPSLRECSLGPIVKRVADLETKAAVYTTEGPDALLMADPDQIEQMLINLIRNAAEAALEQPRTGSNGNASPSASDAPAVRVHWEATTKDVIVMIEDNGAGLSNPHNVFVPFYTTKASGSGIGLVLSRQIAEAHGGSIELSNRSQERGCVVKVVLPIMLSMPRSSFPVSDAATGTSNRQLLESGRPM